MRELAEMIERGELKETDRVRPEGTDEWLRSRIAGGGRIMGFGHRVYKTDDPRSVMLHDVARRLGGPRVAFAEHVERRAIAILG